MHLTSVLAIADLEARNRATEERLKLVAQGTKEVLQTLSAATPGDHVNEAYDKLSKLFDEVTRDPIHIRARTIHPAFTDNSAENPITLP